MSYFDPSFRVQTAEVQVVTTPDNPERRIIGSDLLEVTAVPVLGRAVHLPEAGIYVESPFLPGLRLYVLAVDTWRGSMLCVVRAKRMVE